MLGVYKAKMVKCYMKRLKKILRLDEVISLSVAIFMIIMIINTTRNCILIYCSVMGTAYHLN